MSGNSLEESAPYFAQQLEEQRIIAAINLRRRTEVSSQMAELLADEKWETYRRHIAEMKKFHVEREEKLQAIVLSTLSLDDVDTRKARIDYLTTKARVASFTECLTIVETLIESGKQGSN